MEIEVVEKVDNKLLNRTEVHFRVVHTGKKTTERELVKSDLAEMFKVKKEQVIVDHIKSKFGTQESIGYAKVYKTIDDAVKVEPDYLLKRNKAASKKAEKEEEAEVKPEEKEAVQPETEETQEAKPEEKSEEKKEQSAEEKKEEQKTEDKTESNKEVKDVKE